jgi:peptidoglycan/xylan/chitin deacetylase (PgdA/CDA1 family)
VTVLGDTEHPFAVCLTHDVDRPTKTPLHALYYALADRDVGHLRAMSERVNPYWQFESIMDLEDDLGVRSAFYFLSEPSLRERSLGQLLDRASLVQLIGRYDVRDPAIAEVVERLDEGGWEVGLHGSFDTPRDRERLLIEKSRLESVLDHDVLGGRQHYLRLATPETWRHHRAIGLRYDASLGSPTTAGFQDGYDLLFPFDDAFAVFPLTLMDQQLPDPDQSFWDAWAVCESLFDTAAANDAVMTVLVHPRYFSERDFPGYTRLYRRLIVRARERGAWIGAPGDFYERFVHGSAPADAAGSSVDSSPSVE